MKTTYKFFGTLILCSSLCSCKDFLDVKPDKKLELPQTLQDCQALLADHTVMNETFPYIDEQSADNYFITPENYNNLEVIDRESYIWKSDADVNYGIWSSAYLRILNANQVLTTLGDITPSGSEQATWNTLKGAALFFRGYTLYTNAQIWALPYDSTTADKDLGIPVHLTPDVDEGTSRGTVRQTYQQIIKDLEEAADLLPAGAPATIVSKATLPVKAAALGALAKTYLSMRNYAAAAAYADACLQQYNTLMDYRLLDTITSYPIVQFNDEVLFDASSSFSTPLYYGLVDTTLYRSYDPDDLRRAVFYMPDGAGYYKFRGGYHGAPRYYTFAGIATDEIYLIRAECNARAGNTVSAMADLNTLLEKRWKGKYTPIAAPDATAALDIILQERRKELPFRNVRWTDLRRLNKETRYAVTLTRVPGQKQFTLPPNDLKYVLRIPLEVLNRVNIPQNPR